MKAKLRTTQSGPITADTLESIKEAVQAEIETRYNELYKTISKEGVVQTLVTVFYILEIQYGWSDLQIHEFKDNILELFELLAHPRGLAKNLDVDLIEQHIIEKNIDIRKELTIELDDDVGGI